MVMQNITGNVNLRCDALVEVTVKSGRKVLEREMVPIDALQGHLAVLAYTYVGVSGMATRDATSKPRPRYTMRTEMSNVLASGQECPCPRHLPSN